MAAVAKVLSHSGLRQVLEIGPSLFRRGCKQSQHFIVRAGALPSRVAGFGVELRCAARAAAFAAVQRRSRSPHPTSIHGYDQTTTLCILQSHF